MTPREIAERLNKIVKRPWKVSADNEWVENAEGAAIFESHTYPLENDFIAKAPIMFFFCSRLYA